MIPSGTNLLKVKDYNIAVVLNLIRKYEPISRREIADRTGLSFQTVTNITQNLFDLGVIQEGLELRGNGVRQSRSLQINPNAAYAIGIHIDRAKLTIVLTNFEARALWREEISLTVGRSVRAILPLIQEAVNRAVQEAEISREQLLGAGLAVPGPLNIEAGCLLNVPNLSDWANHPIRSELEELLGFPVVLDEDVTAIVLGEQWCGLGAECLNVLYLYVGIGIGLGILFAPMSGEETRENLSRRAGDLADSAKDLVDQGKERVRTTVSAMRGKAERFVGEATGTGSNV